MAEVTAAAPITISVVATNDVHGQLGRLPVFGGYVSNLKRARGRDGGVLLVDAGDMFQGTIESNVNEGAALIAAYNALGYRAAALGNHEFDFGPAGPKGLPETPEDDPRGALVARLREASFPILSANLRDESNVPPKWTNLAPSTIVDVAGIRVGIVGLLTVDTPDIVKRPLFRNLRVAPLAETAATEASRVRSRGAQVVVLVAHAGGACKDVTRPLDLSSCDGESEVFRLARALPSGSVDAIIGGHRNAAVAHVVNGVPVAHAPSHLVAFSRIDIVVDRATGAVRERRVLPPRPLCSDPKAPVCTAGDYESAPVVRDEAVERSVAPALESARALAAKAVGVRVETPFPVAKSSETALGNLFVDIMRSAIRDADVAFSNAGSIRDVLPSGDLTFGALHHVMPFDNQLARLRMTGAQFRALLRANLTQPAHGAISISGLRAELQCKGSELTVDVLRRNGKKVRDTEELVVVTSDFLAWGGDGLLGAIGFPDDRVAIVPGEKLIEVLARGLATRRTVRADDPALFDAQNPRIRLPGPLPAACH